MTVRSDGAQLAPLADRIADRIAQGWVRSLIDSVVPPAEAKAALESESHPPQPEQFSDLCK